MVGFRLLRRLCIAFVACLFLFSSGPNAQDPPYIQGTSWAFGWEIEVSGSQGVFRADGEEWEIELYLGLPGLNGFLRQLSFLGRKPDNFVNVNVFVNDRGTSFLVSYYNYKANRIQTDEFLGKYQVVGMRAAPTLQPNYVPIGRVPDYEGLDFRLTSKFAEIVPAGGSISHEQLSMDVYPLLSVEEIPDVWIEFWALGVAPSADHTYFLLLYTNSRYAWILDLSSGEILNFPQGVLVGRATVTGGTVHVRRSIVLNPPTR